MEPEKPMETTRDLHRFEIAVPAGKSIVQRVTEEFTRIDDIALNSTNDDTIRLFLKSSVSNDEAKKALKEVLDRRAKLHDTQRELASVQQQLKDITEDQGRLRANLDKVPPTSAAYKRYLEKFDKQEPVIEKFQEEIKQMNEVIKTLQKELEACIVACTW
jgi:peptidoglycan hydrolase CwlO-like protein